jgi:hypothetical protein
MPVCTSHSQVAVNGASRATKEEEEETKGWARHGYTRINFGRNYTDARRSILTYRDKRLAPDTAVLGQI